ncbi:hypothetical protein D3C87_259670 [compost metagenome]
MKLNLKPKAWIKSLAAGLSVLSMCITPLAHGAQAVNQKQLINQYLKNVGLTTKKMTVGEYWAKVRHVYPLEMRGKVDHWVARNRHQAMPKVEASSFKGSDGKEQVRVNLIRDGKVVTLTFIGDDDKFAKFNNVTFSKKELLSGKGLIAKVESQDPAIAKLKKNASKQPTLGKNVILNLKEYAKLTNRQKAEYHMRLRLAMNAAQRVQDAFYGAKKTSSNDFETKYQWALELLFGAQAHAQSLVGAKCVIAGFVSVYGENRKCGGNRQGEADLKRQAETMGASCSGKDTPCNPLVYGFNASGGSYCVPPKNILYATNYCNQESKLRSGDPALEAQDKKRIIETFLKKKHGKDMKVELNEEGKIEDTKYTQEIKDYLGSLQTLIDEAGQLCDTAPLKDIKKKLKDQDSACEELRIRAISLQQFAVTPTPAPVPLPPPVGRDCDAEMTGSVATEDGTGCVCPDGMGRQEVDIPAAPQPTGAGRVTQGESSRPVCGPIGGYIGDDYAELPAEKTVPEKKEKDSDWGPWPWIIGIAAVGGIAWWLISKSNSKEKDKVNNNYVPPVAPPGTLPPTTPEPPPVAPPPTAPCEPPNMLVGSVCTQPEIVGPPAAPPTEGGTTTDIDGRAGGVR